MKIKQLTIALQRLLNSPDINVPTDKMKPSMDNLMWMSMNLPLINKPSEKLYIALNLIDLLKAKMIERI